MELFTKEAMTHLMQNMLVSFGVNGNAARWLQDFNYKQSLKDRLAQMYNVLKQEYSSKRDAGVMSTANQAFYEGALCRLQHEMGVELSSLYLDMLADSPKEVRFSYTRGFNTHFKEFGQINVEYPTLSVNYH